MLLRALSAGLTQSPFGGGAGSQYGAGIQKELACPKGMVGRVIGKGGETIKALQKNFGANIQIDQSSDPMRITIAGQPPAVEACAAAVQEIVNGGNPYLGPPGGAASAYGAQPSRVHAHAYLSLRAVSPRLHGTNA